MTGNSDNFLGVSGRAFIRGDELIWETRKGQTLVQIPIDRIQIIGEYTTIDEPDCDEWYFLFVIGPREFHSISAFAEGMVDVLTELSVLLGAEIQGQFTNSNTWQTQVLWPPKLHGRTLFKQKELEPTNIWQALTHHIGFLKMDIALAEELLPHLK